MCQYVYSYFFLEGVFAHTGLLWCDRLYCGYGVCMLIFKRKSFAGGRCGHAVEHSLPRRSRGPTRREMPQTPPLFPSFLRPKKEPPANICLNPLLMLYCNHRRQNEEKPERGIETCSPPILPSATRNVRMRKSPSVGLKRQLNGIDP